MWKLPIATLLHALNSVDAAMCALKVRGRCWCRSAEGDAG